MEIGSVSLFYVSLFQDNFVYKYEPPCYDSGGGGDEGDEATADTDSAARKRVCCANAICAYNLKIRWICIVYTNMHSAFLRAHLW